MNCLGVTANFFTRYLSQVMRLNFTRESHLRRFNSMLAYNLPQEMGTLK